MATNTVKAPLTVKDLLEDWAFNRLSEGGTEFNQSRANEVEVREESYAAEEECGCCDGYYVGLSIYLNGVVVADFYGEIEDYLDEIAPPNLRATLGMDQLAVLAELERLVASDDEAIEADCE